MAFGLPWGSCFYITVLVCGVLSVLSRALSVPPVFTRQVGFGHVY